MGCGHIGSSGIEVGGFYSSDFAQDPAASPHYCFCEMGRNYYILADRHGASKDGAYAQALLRMASASCAAQRDLSDHFVDRWRLPLSPRARQALGELNW